jgi:hypothetical protein
MSIYLVVADRGTWSQGFLTGLAPIAKQDPAARFVLVLPMVETPGVSEAEALREATESAARARTTMRLAGLHVVEAMAGDPLPKKAIEDELSRGVHHYDAIVIGARSRGLPRGTEALAAQLERHHGIPVLVIEPRVALTRLDPSPAPRR